GRRYGRLGTRAPAEDFRTFRGGEQRQVAQEDVFTRGACGEQMLDVPEHAIDGVRIGAPAVEQNAHGQTGRGRHLHRDRIVRLLEYLCAEDADARGVANEIVV